MATDYASLVVQLEAALARGELTIEANGERITYKSAPDLINAINYMRSQMARGSQTTQVVFDR
jgi:hypothetical protein